MSGKRILDAVALLGASRNIAYNHFAIRLRQAELYAKTSSILAVAADPRGGNMERRPDPSLSTRGGNETGDDIFAEWRIVKPRHCPRFHRMIPKSSYTFHGWLDLV